MIDILIRFEFRFTDRRGRNQSGAVMIVICAAILIPVGTGMFAGLV